jgi:tetratricopeptide (TPR) repeat protein
LALVVGDTHDIRSRILAREGDLRGALTSLEKATPYLERAVDKLADDATIRLSLVKLLQRAAVLHARLEEEELATAQYRRAISVLDCGITLVPGHRNLTQRRATVEFALARCQLAAGDERQAQASLEAAVRDYADIGLCNHDSTSIWMRSVRCWQMLGRLYGEENRRSDAITAYDKSLALLEAVKPRRGHSPQFAEYSGLSRNALAKLAPQRGKGSVQ